MLTADSWRRVQTPGSRSTLHSCVHPPMQPLHMNIRFDQSSEQAATLQSEARCSGEFEKKRTGQAKQIPPIHFQFALPIHIRELSLAPGSQTTAIRLGTFCTWSDLFSVAGLAHGTRYNMLLSVPAACPPPPPPPTPASPRFHRPQGGGLGASRRANQPHPHCRGS